MIKQLLFLIGIFIASLSSFGQSLPDKYTVDFEDKADISIGRNSFDLITADSSGQYYLYGYERHMPKEPWDAIGLTKTDKDGKIVYEKDLSKAMGALHLKKVFPMAITSIC